MPRRRVTLADVARAAGVSKTAASFALNGRPGVSEATRARVREIADELGWHPNASGRALARSRAFAVGFVVTRPAHLLGVDPFFPDFVSGLETVLAAHDHALLLRVVRDAAEEDRVHRWLARSGAVDGLIVTDLRRADPRPALLAGLGVPTVVLGEWARRGATRGCSWVWIDDRVGTTDAVAHLVDLGHRDVAHVSGPPVYLHTASRRRAVRQALRVSGLRPAAVEQGDFTAEGGAAATKRLLDRPRRPSAIVYANDLMALAGMAVLREAGLDVPGDVSVVGYDDVPLAEYAHPPLSTIGSDAVDWGRAAASELLRLLDGAAPRTVDLPAAELLLRATTAPPPDHIRAGREGARLV